jgi:hypothetical protein
LASKLRACRNVRSEGTAPNGKTKYSDRNADSGRHDEKDRITKAVGQKPRQTSNQLSWQARVSLGVTPRERSSLPRPEQFAELKARLSCA